VSIISLSPIYACQQYLCDVSFCVSNVHMSPMYVTSDSVSPESMCHQCRCITNVCMSLMLGSLLSACHQCPCLSVSLVPTSPAYVVPSSVSLMHVCHQFYLPQECYKSPEYCLLITTVTIPAINYYIQCSN